MEADQIQGQDPKEEIQVVIQVLELDISAMVQIQGQTMEQVLEAGMEGFTSDPKMILPTTKLCPRKGIERGMFQEIPVQFGLESIPRLMTRDLVSFTTNLDRLEYSLN